MADDLAYAYQAGGWARENGRTLASCPAYALGELGQKWRDQWKAGWEAKDRELSKGVRRG